MRNRVMRTTTILLTMLLVSCAGHPPAMTTGHAVGDETSAGRGRALAQNDSGTCEIVYIPAHVLSRIPYTPEKLQRNFYFKLTVRISQNSNLLAEMAKVVDSARVQREVRVLDARWGFIIRDKDKIERWSLYLDSVANIGLCNGEQVTLNNDHLYPWLGQAFKPIFR